jgi:hypothetical protein
MEQSSSTTSEERQARIQRKIDANIRCKGFFKNINLWKNTIALRDCDRVNVLCDFLEAQFENADPSWDDYWLDLRSFALTWSRLDGITPVSQEAFAKYKVLLQYIMIHIFCSFSNRNGRIQEFED